MDANIVALILYGLIALFMVGMAGLVILDGIDRRAVDRARAERHARYLALRTR